MDGVKPDNLGPSSIIQRYTLIIGQFLQLHPIIGQFLRFSVVGGLGVVVDFSTYLLLKRYAGLTPESGFSLWGLPLIYANMASVLTAMVPVFFLNKYWSLADQKTNQLARQGSSFFLLYSFSWILNQILVSFFVFRVTILSEYFGNNADVVAKTLAVCIILFINFTGLKLFVFRDT
tara:strand:- start:72 stop:599 length:528 start_codon:yes stop_codon:yes gene_type:complete